MNFTIANPDNFYIKKQADLDNVIKLITKAKIVALDTEFTRETTYYPILSIIQIAVKGDGGNKELFIIDCLANINLQPLFEIIANPDIVKILHSSLQDLQIFYHQSSLLPQNIFDTQIMANFCGFGYSVGYSSLTEVIFDQALDKKQQRSNWQKRPLTKKQIEYALLDVFYLEEIYHKFLVILKNKKRLAWYLEEIETFTKKSLFKADSDLYKKFSFKKKDALQVVQMKNLILLREHWARKMNIPRQHLIKDVKLEQIILNQKIDFKFNDEMLREVEKILATDSISKEHLQKSSPAVSFIMSEEQKKLYNQAKELISEFSLQENLKEQFLINRSDLKKIISSHDSLTKLISGWRYQLFGRDLKNLIS